MEQSYWDLSSIVAESVRLPCHFAFDVPNLAHLVGTNQASAGGAVTSAGGVDGGSSAHLHDALTIQKKSRVDLPYWLAELLALHNVVDLSFPRQYSPRVKNALDAQAKSVRLRDLNGWWYAVGIRLSSLTETKDLVETLIKAYQARITPIYSSMQNLAASAKIDATNEALMMINEDVDSFGADLTVSMSTEMQEFLRGLDESEVVLMGAGQRSTASTLRYLSSVG